MCVSNHSRRDFLRALGVGVAALAMPESLLANGLPRSSKRKPNVVFILVDDLGWKDLGCYGSTFYETPNIDGLAASGALFTDAYSASPVCSPTRASILTGKYPTRLAITDWIPEDRPRDRKLLGPTIRRKLPLNEVTIAEAMKEVGYATFSAGKWHLGSEGFGPEQQGFDINKGGHRKGSPPGGYYSPYKNPTLQDGPEGEYLTDRLTDESIRFLEEHSDTPFLLFLSFYTVHTPIEACKRHIDTFRAKADELPKPEGPPFVAERNGWTKQSQDDPAYASMVYALDENVGRLLKKLDELPLADNTAVIFTSDNRGLSTLGQKWSPTSNVPLRAGKGWCYEGGIRVPLIIRAPGIGKPGTLCSDPVISTDFYRTILDIAREDPRPHHHIDSLSLVPLLEGRESLDRDAVFWHYPHYHSSMWTPGSAVRAGDWKLIEFYEEDKIELYSLREDIGERQDLSERMPEKVRELRSKLRAWLRATHAELPGQNPDYHLA